VQLEGLFYCLLINPITAQARLILLPLYRPQICTLPLLLLNPSKVGTMEVTDIKKTKTG